VYKLLTAVETPLLDKPRDAYQRFQILAVLVIYSLLLFGVINPFSVIPWPLADTFKLCAT